MPNKKLYTPQYIILYTTHKICFHSFVHSSVALCDCTLLSYYWKNVLAFGKCKFAGDIFAIVLFSFLNLLCLNVLKHEGMTKKNLKGAGSRGDVIRRAELMREQDSISNIREESLKIYWLGLSRIIQNFIHCKRSSLWGHAIALSIFPQQKALRLENHFAKYFMFELKINIAELNMTLHFISAHLT